mmetsp:Transcript_3/g.4  ORF Transcript_3/g.4 Transcript_3/m.4 type:complete len:315 (+) Transcript_3:35-979(+)
MESPLVERKRAATIGWRLTEGNESYCRTAFFMQEYCAAPERSPSGMTASTSAGTDSDSDRALDWDFSHLQVKNTFVHMGEEEQLDERRFASAPEGWPLFGGEIFPPVPGVMVDFATALNGTTKMIMDHLRNDSCGLNLSTIGNRVPTEYAVVLKARGVRISDIVHSMPGVTVSQGVARQHGVEARVEVVPTHSRGEFLKKLKRGQVTEEEVDAVTDVLNAVYHLIAEAEDQQQSTFALGNWLPPKCRAFMKGYSLRLLELLKQFPAIFTCRGSGSAAMPVVRIVPHAVVCPLEIRQGLAARKMRFEAQDRPIVS